MACDLADDDQVRHAADVVLRDRPGWASAALGGSSRSSRTRSGRHPRTPGSSGVAEEEFEAVLVQQALPRALVPADVAATVAFLARPEAAALTGQTITTDGGVVLR